VVVGSTPATGAFSPRKLFLADSFARWALRWDREFIPDSTVAKSLAERRPRLRLRL